MNHSCDFLNSGMDPDLYPAIFKRKSFHIFRNLEDLSLSQDELDDIGRAYDALIPLDPSIRTAIRIVKEEETTCRRGAEYCILLYSEKKASCLANIGYLGEQLDLYLTDRNIATLWFGIGRITESSWQGLDFMIMIAIRKAPAASCFRKDMFKSRRRDLDEIWQGPLIEGVSPIVRFAPSACNSQPWFVENTEKLAVYRKPIPGKRGIMPQDMVTFYNRIDIGIFLCFLELCLDHNGIAFCRTLYEDDGNSAKALNAVYALK